MKILHVKLFPSSSWDLLVKFVNTNNIPREEILTITTDGSFYSLFFYA